MDTEIARRGWWWWKDSPRLVVKTRWWDEEEPRNFAPLKPTYMWSIACLRTDHVLRAGLITERVDIGNDIEHHVKEPGINTRSVCGLQKKGKQSGDESEDVASGTTADEKPPKALRTNGRKWFEATCPAELEPAAKETADSKEDHKCHTSKEANGRNGGYGCPNWQIWKSELIRKPQQRV
ncbi:hypothetical protein CPB85DRAFT_1263519 [Mucidula mucida]|nr:hypothetical protein CPB85DRAFT_1263519 [Mucidula mucida]